MPAEFRNGEPHCERTKAGSPGWPPDQARAEPHPESGTSHGTLLESLDTDHRPGGRPGDAGGAGDSILQDEDAIGSLVDPGSGHPGRRVGAGDPRRSAAPRRGAIPTPARPVQGSARARIHPGGVEMTDARRPTPGGNHGRDDGRKSDDEKTKDTKKESKALEARGAGRAISRICAALKSHGSR